MRSLATLATLLFLAVFACAEQPTSPADLAETSEVTVDPLSNFNNNPDGGSIHIFRYQRHVVFALFDPNSSLAAAITTADQCGGGVLEPADVQDVVEDPDAGPFTRVRELILADPVNIHIVDFSSPGSCFGLAQVAQGTGKAMLTDNDVTAFLIPGNNANAFGIMANGKLVDDTGQRWTFSGQTRFVWDGEDLSTLKVNEKFNLKPTGN